MNTADDPNALAAELATFYAQGGRRSRLAGLLREYLRDEHAEPLTLEKLAGIVAQFPGAPALPEDLAGRLRPDVAGLERGVSARP